MIKSFHASKALIKREFSAYFHSPLALVFLIAFLFLNTFLTFRFGFWFELGKADILPFFTFQPWLYLFLIPALAMRTWAEEEREGTVELLLTMPVTVGQVVLCKFIASWLFVGLSLLLTFPMPATAFFLGDPDVGRIISGYIASFLLGGTFLAIAAIPSALSRNQVISYILSFFILLLLSGLALTQVNTLIPDALSVDMRETLSLFSVEPHFEAFQRGVLDARDLFYNLSVIAYALTATAIILRYRKASHKFNRFFSLVGSVVLLLILIFANIFAKHASWRWDLTDDDLYSLSQDSKNILSGLEKPLKVRFYFSRNSKETTPSQKAHALRIRDLLKEYSLLSEGRFSYEVIDPAANAEFEAFARFNGMQSINGDDTNPVFCGLALQYLNRNLQIENAAALPEEELEYEITRRIRQIVRPKKPLIATLTQSPIYYLKADPVNGRYQDQPQWRIITELIEEYGLQKDVDLVNLPRSIPNISAKVDLLIMIHPPQLDEMTLYALDQYLVRGGKILCFVDSFAALNVKQNQAGEMLVPRSSNLLGLAGHWGVRFIDDKVLIDQDNARVVQNQRVPSFLDLKGEALSTSDAATKGLKNLLLAYSGVFEYREKEGLEKTILLESSENAQLRDRSLAMQNEKLKETFKADGKKYALGMRINGRFDSAFANDELPEGFKLENHALKSEKEAAVVLVGDADFLSDDFAYQTKERGQGVEISEKISGNIDFFMNLVDGMLNDKTLTTLRSRLPQPRRLDVLEDYKVAISAENSDAKKALFAQYKANALEEDKVLKKRQAQIELSLGEDEKLQKSQSLRERAEKQLRSLQLEETLAIKAYQNFIFLLNLLAVPIILCLIAIAVAVLRYLRVKRS